MISLMPKTVSSSDIQKRYREIFDEVKKTKEPVIVLHGNKPDVAIVDYKHLEELENKSYEAEIKDTLNAARKGRREHKTGKTIKVKSLADLI